MNEQPASISSVEQHGDAQSHITEAAIKAIRPASPTQGPAPAVQSTIPLPPKPRTVTPDQDQTSAHKENAERAVEQSSIPTDHPTVTPSIELSLTQDPNAPSSTTTSSALYSSTGQGSAADPLQLIGREQIEPQRPHPSQNLVHMYGLSKLAASVARFDPITGEKINRLRKSYEGQATKLGLSGKNKAVKDEGDSGDNDLKKVPLSQLLQVPAEIWQNFREKRPIHRGWEGRGSWDISGEFAAKLEKACKFESLPVSRALNAEWESLLGFEKPRIKTSKSSGSNLAATGTPRPNGLVNSPAAGVGAGASIPRTGTPSNTAADAARPRRSGKKRRYNDDSFEGYGEGFLDDDGISDGNISSNDGSRTERKKRRKDSSVSNTPRPLGRTTSYGPGMIHQSGIGAFGR